jgi:hypothetical protein
MNLRSADRSRHPLRVIVGLDDADGQLAPAHRAQVAGQAVGLGPEVVPPSVDGIVLGI